MKTAKLKALGIYLDNIFAKVAWGMKSWDLRISMVEGEAPDVIIE